MDERRDDWKRGVDENLASLNAGQRIWERELKAIRKALAELDDLVRGDVAKETDGIIARLHQVENTVNLLKAVVMKDAAGGRGLVGRLEAIEKGEHRSDNLWKFVTALAVAILSFLGLLITNWDRLAAFWNRKSTDPVEQMIERAKHPKPRHRHIIIRPPPDESESED